MKNYLITKFENVVQKSPYKIAVFDDNYKNTTYTELNDRSNFIAQMLYDKGIRSNNVVALLLPKNIDLISSILGVLKLNATYLPIDTNYPVERIKFILKKADAKCLVTQTECDHFKTTNKLLLNRDFFAKSQNKIFDFKTNDKAKFTYMIFTSGSTGNPKGIKIKFDSFLNLVKWYINILNMNSNSIVTLLASIGFDLAQKNVLAPLIVGGAISLPHVGLLDYDSLSRHIRDTKSTIASWTPSAFAPLLENDESIKNISSLKYVVLGGEPLKIRSFKKWLTSNECNCKLINIYGPTECTDVATYYELNKSNNESDKLDLIPIGKPLPNVKIKLQNKEENSEIGEMYIGGIGVADGYYNDEALTNKSFIKDKVTNEVYFKTGDLAKKDLYGNYIFQGRNDNQVKIRGNRVEVEEVEKVFQNLLDIDSQIIVCPYLTSANTNNLAAFYTNPKIDINNLVAKAKKRLPNYMIPNKFNLLKSIPLSPNGKIDKKRLSNTLDYRNIAKLPKKEISKNLDFKDTIRQLWENSLSIKVEENTNFFKEGGDSLRALILVAKIKQILKKNITVKDLFEEPIFKNFCSLIETKKKIASSTKNTNSYGEFNVTPRIKEAYYLTKKLNNLPDRNLFTVLKSDTPIDKKNILSAIDKLKLKHDVLREHFYSNENKLKLIESKDKQKQYCFIDYSNDVFSRSNFDLIYKLSSYKFNLSKDNLFKVYQIKYKNCDILILLTNHLISDGQSMEILKNDFIKAISNNKSINRKKDYSFEHYCNRINQKYYLSSKPSNTENFWKEKLKNASKFWYLPPKDFKIAGKIWNATKLRLNIKSNSMKIIISVCKKLNITVPIYFIGISNIVLSNWMQKEKFIAQIQVSGRTSESEQTALGYFANSIYLIANSLSNDDINAYFNNLMKEFVSILQYQNFPDEKAAKLIAPNFYSPIFYNFIMSDTSTTRNGINEVELQTKYQGELSNFDLIVEGKINNTTKQTSMDLIYKPKQNSELTILYLLLAFEQEINYINNKVLYDGNNNE